MSDILKASLLDMVGYQDGAVKPHALKSISRFKMMLTMIRS